jgi:hypothetical protein
MGSKSDKNGKEISDIRLRLTAKEEEFARRFANLSPEEIRQRLLESPFKSINKLFEKAAGNVASNIERRVRDSVYPSNERLNSRPVEEQISWYKKEISRMNRRITLLFMLIRNDREEFEYQFLKELRSEYERLLESLQGEKQVEDQNRDKDETEPQPEYKNLDEMFRRTSFIDAGYDLLKNVNPPIMCTNRNDKGPLLVWIRAMVVKDIIWPQNNNAELASNLLKKFPALETFHPDTVEAHYDHERKTRPLAEKKYKDQFNELIDKNPVFQRAVNSENF